MKEQILQACRADDIEAGDDGLWSVKKLALVKGYEGEDKGRKISLAPGVYTQLFHMGQYGNPYVGDLVMHDFPAELLTHLDFMLKAHGKVLVTGLGLGCVVRGLLANPNVKHVTVLEKNKSVMRLVYPYMPQTRRLTILRAEAQRWTKETRQVFDCAYHDLWTDQSAGEPHLQIVHNKCVIHMRKKVNDIHFAWQATRWMRRIWRTQFGINVL